MPEPEHPDRQPEPQRRTEPQPDATLCAECQGKGVLASGETCPVCLGSGKANARTGGG